MTLVCALKCNNGIVVGSDGQASVNTAGGPIKHKIQKIYKIGNKTIFLASGTIGLIQKILNVTNSHSADFDKELGINTLEDLKKEIFPIVVDAKEAYEKYNGKTEGIPAIDLLICGLDKNKSPRMWHMARDTHDEFIDVVGCYCSGNGETFGYSLLKSLMQSSSNLESGKLIMYRTIRDTIESLAAGVGYPIDLWYLKDSGEVHQLSNDELDGLAVAYKKWKSAEAKFLSGDYNGLQNK